ncbi:MAG TPA: hypothetical protein VM308_10715 [Sphingomicrobium sp.]|nr:hypothetical protein [Sphingomicrobium sp.]
MRPSEPSTDSEWQRPGRVLIALLLLAVFARAICWPQRPPDMGLFLEPWFAHIVHHGPIQAFAHPFSNYAPAYLYLLALGSLAHELFTPMAIIKALSVGGSLFLAFALSRLLKAVGTDGRKALLVLILPSVIINDALLGQCDALWAGSCILALAEMIRGRTIAAMVWCGVAIAFKAQAAFIAPVIIGAMIGRRAPLWQWAVPAGVFLATLVPPWLLGWPAWKLLTVYFDQAAYVEIAGRLSNPWMFGTVFAPVAVRDWFVLGYAASGAAAIVIAALAARNWHDGRVLIVLAALAATALPFLLPKMLERYYFLGDVMTLALALCLQRRLAIVAFAAVQAASLLAHVTYIYFYHEPYPALAGAIIAATGIAALIRLGLPQLQQFWGELGPRRWPQVRRLTERAVG